MDWTELLRQICEICVIPLLGVLTGYLVALINAKKNEIKAKTKNEKVRKYIDMLSATITACVQATNQTYVEALKDKDLFNEDAQREAFQQTFNAVIGILSDEARLYLSEAYGDLDELITAKIEAEVSAQKTEPLF